MGIVEAILNSLWINSRISILGYIVMLKVHDE